MHAIQCYQKCKNALRSLSPLSTKKQIKSGLYWKKAQIEKNSEYVCIVQD